MDGIAKDRVAQVIAVDRRAAEEMVSTQMSGPVVGVYVRSVPDADSPTMSATDKGRDDVHLPACRHLWRKTRIFRVRTGLFVRGCTPCRTKWALVRDAHLHA